MTVNALELVLYDLGVKREARAAFRDNAADFLRRYALDADEVALVASFDVAAMQKRGASPLLTLGYWMTNEPGRSRRDYCARLQAAG